MNEILRRISADKAMGPDLISDKWFRKRRNAMPFMDWIKERIKYGAPRLE